MRKIAILAAAATLGAGALSSTGAEARWRGGGGAVAAGLIGGLAAGALLGAATSDYGYGYGYGGYARPVYGDARPAYGYGGYGYADGYRSVGYDDGYDAPRYRTRRVVRETYDYAPGGYSWGGPVYDYGY